MIFRYVSAALFILITLFGQAQITLKGRVIDERTEEPLAFVHLVVVGTREGTQSDIDGLFTLSVSSLPVTIRTAYLGYANAQHEITTSDFRILRILQTANELAEVRILPTENPAHSIIKAVYENRKVNAA